LQSELATYRDLYKGAARDLSNMKNVEQDLQAARETIKSLEKELNEKTNQGTNLSFV
jgi:hypothetical protein